MAEPEVNAGFGDALTAALDVMAFTHDLDLGSANQPIASLAQPAPTLPIAVSSTTLTVPTEVGGKSQE